MDSHQLTFHSVTVADNINNKTGNVRLT